MRLVELVIVCALGVAPIQDVVAGEPLPKPADVLNSFPVVPAAVLESCEMEVLGALRAVKCSDYRYEISMDEVTHILQVFPRGKFPTAQACSERLRAMLPTAQVVGKQQKTDKFATFVRVYYKDERAQYMVLFQDWGRRGGTSCQFIACNPQSAVSETTIFDCTPR